jgi:hypothetical protein
MYIFPEPVSEISAVSDIPYPLCSDRNTRFEVTDDTRFHLFRQTHEIGNGWGGVIAPLFRWEVDRRLFGFRCHNL